MTILQSLAAFYDRLDRRGDAPKQGYALVGVSFAIPIARDGSLQRAIDLRTVDGRRPSPSDRLLPKLRDHNNSGKDPFLFWDNTGYALGLVKKEMKRGTPSGLFECFKEANLAATEGASGPELAAFRAFLQGWRCEDPLPLGLPEDALDSNVVFRCQETGRLIHESEEAREIWLGKQVTAVTATQLCLVTGERLPMARLHPKFPALVSGGNKAPLVSFNESAFESYEKEQGDNGPVSEEAAFKYGAALNWLLDRSNARAFRLGETTAVYWADEKEVGEKAAEAVEDQFWIENSDDSTASDDVSNDEEEDGKGPDDDIDADEAHAMSNQAQNVRHQRRAPNPADLKPETRLHVLGLSPNAGRIAVRFWLFDSWGEISKNIDRFKNDIRIEPADRNPDHKAYALLYETAVQRKRENIPPRLGGELARAILMGTPYPRTLFAAVIARIRADKTINAARAGIVKAVINREHGEEIIPVALDPANSNPAYRLGRLFALIEGAQKAALPGIKATVKDRYFGAACATPARIFPLLHKNAMNHIAAVRKERGPGLAHWIEREVGGIWAGLSDELPRALRLEEQGRFIAGYYHQRFSKTADTPAEAQTVMANDTEETEK